MIAQRAKSRSEKDGKIRRYVSDREILVREAVGAKRIMVAYVNRPVMETQANLTSQAWSPVAY